MPQASGARVAWGRTAHAKSDGEGFSEEVRLKQGPGLEKRRRKKNASWRGLRPKE